MPPTAGPETTRRAFLTKAAYVAPAILTLPAVLSIASAGSGGGKGAKPSPPPVADRSRDRGDSCSRWWHIFWCFPPWEGGGPF